MKYLKAKDYIALVLFISGIAYLTISIFSLPSSEPAGRTPLVVNHMAQPVTFEDVLDAIEFVESGNRPSVTGDGGKAVGAYQLWPIYLADANRISGRSYTLADRLDRDKSREMTRIVLTHYGKDVPLDKIAAIHISPSNRDLDRPAAVEYLRKINLYLEARK